MASQLPPKQSQIGTGAWIFLSHSHKDFDKVREIRNELERRGHRPLMFFLKCLENDDALLPDLLKREISARQWFVLCDSPNAQASRWVREEMEMIEAMEGKVFEKVDLSKDLETELHKLVGISKRATVFLSYTTQDSAIAERIRAALERHDYRVWDDTSVGAGADWASAIRTAIDDAVNEGFVLLLLSPESVSSQWCHAATLHALQRAAQSARSNIIPVIIAPFDPSALTPQLRMIQWFDLTTGQFDERMEELIANMKTREME